MKIDTGFFIAISTIAYDVRLWCKTKLKRLFYSKQIKRLQKLAGIKQ